MKEYKLLRPFKGINADVKLYGYDNEDEFHEIRRQGITGTDISVIMGTNPYVTQKELLDAKLNGAQREQNEAMFWGTKLEGVVADVYAERSGCRFENPYGALSTENLPSVDNVSLIGNVDRLIIDKDGAVIKILEIKTGNSFTAKRWADGAIPAWYVDQVMWYMGITGIREADFAVLLGGQDYFTRTVRFNGDYFEEMKNAAQIWWKRHVIDKEPLVDNKITFPTEKSDCVYREEITPFADAYKQANDAYKQAEKDRHAARSELIAALGEDLYVSTGLYYVKHSISAMRGSIDSEKLKAELPEIYEKYKKEPATYERIDVRLTF